MRETTTILNPGGWRHTMASYVKVRGGLVEKDPPLFISPEGIEYRETTKRETPDLIIIPTIAGLIPLRLRRYHRRNE